MTALSDPGKPALPLHVQIRRDLEDQIRSGVLMPGQKVAFEHELMTVYNCSRMTVNKAMSALSAAGLIERRKRAGTFVKLPRLDSTVIDIPDIQIDITARGEFYGFELIERRVRTAVTAKERELAGEDGRVLSLTGLHLASGKPLAVEERLINLAAVPQAEAIDFSRLSPGHWLLEAVPWTQVENEISATEADAELTRRLGIEKGQACLVLDRRTWSGPERITTVRQTYDGTRYRLVAHFDTLRRSAPRP
ncbi:histidine utilization repressor [Asticcacaulis sp. ZE23SCel15]|uniref:histidine utilization repressor n=1 Tax=Asticcacaulis sp. ZE23SCel15 TaxID=3059027 RepID=UPI00265F86DE|nr:histidine utilization repressor [Asticcacaulis sp. ZE23SCel15]WKL56055.1 histidine utilization repressor [Asticcacaulis sp. ZE23SCel15]